MPRRAGIAIAVLLAALGAAAPIARADRHEASLFEAPRELMSDDAALRAKTLDEVQGFGVSWVRVVLYWRNVAPNPTDWRLPGGDLGNPASYDWARYDRAIDELRARHFKVLLTVSGPVPNWATRSRHSATMHPSAAQFGRFMRAAGQHYGAQISHWSIWNEPNHPDFLGPQYSRGRAVSPHIYRALFLAGERGLRASGNAHDVVLMGETAPVGTSHVVPPLTFLRGALCLDSRYHKRSSCRRLGADGYAHHAYTHGAPWYRPRSRNDVTIGVLGRLNHALALAGRAGAIRPRLPIWLTEFGIQSKPDPFIGVSEVRQAEFRSISELLAYRNPRVRVFSQYLMRDDAPRPGPRRQRYSGFESGLRHANGRPKRSYEGYRLALVAKRGYSRVFLWGVVRPHHGRDGLTIQYRSRHGHRWRTLKRDRTNTRGVWSTTTAYVPGRRYRVAWRGHHGPPTRVYSRL
jgi:hypothetical protein